MALLPISVLVQTKNEAIGIRACLNALIDFDEVIVVDSNSTDQTAAIARDCGATVVNFTWNGTYPKKKQWQLENVTTRNPWILFLDADETPTPTLIAQLPHLLAHANATRTNAFDLQLCYSFDGRALKHGHRVVKRALLKTGHAVFPTVPDIDAPGMGELEGHYQPVIKGRAEFIADALIHEDKDPVRTWFDRHNRYSDWEAFLRTHKASRRAITRLRSTQGRIFDLAPLKPITFFIYAYLLRQGFRDGLPGLNYAVALAQYYWQINLKVREIKRIGLRS